MNVLGGDPGHDHEEVLWEGAGRLFCRLERDGAEDERHAFVPVISGTPQSVQDAIGRLAHEYELKDDLDAAWALRPVELMRAL